MNSPASAFKRILEAFGRLGIRYCVVGSVASSVYGTPRTTMDVDVVADLRPEQLSALAGELQGEFYVDLEMMKDAVKRGRAFNVIHLASSYKIDVFPLADDEYSQAAFSRRRPSKAKAVGNESVDCLVASAEDTVLNKLRWYRAGGEVSETQWNDLRGILRVTGGQLDQAYLRHWAPQLGVADLLDRLFEEYRA